MEKKPLHLWFAYPEDVLPGTVTEACAQLLSEEERKRWQAFRFDERRREYLTTRALVRSALSRYHSLPPEAWRFQTNAYGKPAVNPDCGLCFNLSNSPELVVCAIAEGIQLGVDAEPFDRSAKITELGAEVFSPLEIAQLEALREEERLDRALSLWTLKESYIKARGIGLSLPLQTISFLFSEAEGIRLEIDPCQDDDARCWRFCLLNQAGHRIALTAGGTDEPLLQPWEARPPLGAPRQIPIGEQRWFPASTQLS